MSKFLVPIHEDKVATQDHDYIEVSISPGEIWKIHGLHARNINEGYNRISVGYYYEGRFYQVYNDIQVANVCVPFSFYVIGALRVYFYGSSSGDKLEVNFMKETVQK